MSKKNKKRTKWLESFLCREGLSGPPRGIIRVTEDQDDKLMQQVTHYEKQLAARKARWNIEGLIRWDEIVQEQITKLKKKGVKGRKPDE